MKDIRLVRDKQAEDQKQYRDFAFVEFFSLEDAQSVLERAKIDRIKVKGSPVFVSYSKFKRPEQYVSTISIHIVNLCGIV